MNYSLKQCAICNERHFYLIQHMLPMTTTYKTKQTLLHMRKQRLLKQEYKHGRLLQILISL